MSCDKYQEYIMRYFDQDLNDIEDLQCKHHLKSCMDCSKLFRTLKETIQLVCEEGKINPPDDFTINVMGKIEEFEAIRSKKTERIIFALYCLTTMFLVSIPVFLFINFSNYFVIFKNLILVLLPTIIEILSPIGIVLCILGILAFEFSRDAKVYSK